MFRNPARPERLHQRQWDPHFQLAGGVRYAFSKAIAIRNGLTIGETPRRTILCAAL
jgi:hypothetical protein